MANDGLVLALIAGGAGAAILAARSAGGGGGTDTSQGGFTPDLGGLGGGLGGLTGDTLLYDPATGQFYDPNHPPSLPGSEGLPGSPGLPGVPGDAGAFGPSFSPEFEAALLTEQQRSNQALEDEARRQGRSNDLANKLTVGLFGVAAAPAAIKVAGAAARGTAAAVRGTANVARSGAQNLQAWKSARDARLAQTASQAARGTATTSRTAALLRTPALRFGGAAAAGVGLGLGGVAVLDKTGALDRVADAGQAIGRNTSQGTQTAIKSAALPLSAIGAVATAAVGRGSVSGNLRDAYRGTVQETVVNATVDAAKDVGGAIGSGAKTGYKATKNFIGGLF